MVRVNAIFIEACKKMIMKAKNFEKLLEENLGKQESFFKQDLVRNGLTRKSKELLNGLL